MKCFSDWTGLIADVASVLTAVFAVLIWCRLKSDIKAKTSKLKKYLNEKGQEERKANPSAKGAFNAVIISRDTGLTESEIFQISVSSSDRIGRLARMDEDSGRAKEVIFFYKDESNA